MRALTHRSWHACTPHTRARSTAALPPHLTSAFPPPPRIKLTDYCRVSYACLPACSSLLQSEYACDNSTVRIVR